MLHEHNVDGDCHALEYGNYHIFLEYVVLVYAK